MDLLFPFLAFMVEDMGYTGERLGYHAGLLAASFCGAQFCTSVPWGMISDRYGRKIAIILGTLGAGIGMFIFGFSKTYAQGTRPVCPVLLSEAADPPLTLPFMCTRCCTL